jgi:integrase
VAQSLWKSLAQCFWKTTQIGLPAIRLHDLRHSAATLLLAQGVHSRIVQDLLGHSTISLTLDVYSHVLPNLQKEAADKMDAIFSA